MSGATPADALHGVGLAVDVVTLGGRLLAERVVVMRSVVAALALFCLPSWAQDQALYIAEDGTVVCEEVESRFSS